MLIPCNFCHMVGIDEAIEFVKDTLTELTLDKENIARPFKVLYKGLKATATLPTVTPLLTPSTHVKYKTFDETNVFDTRKNERKFSNTTTVMFN